MEISLFDLLDAIRQGEIARKKRNHFPNNGGQPFAQVKPLQKWDKSTNDQGVSRPDDHDYADENGSGSKIRRFWRWELHEDICSFMYNLA